MVRPLLRRTLVAIVALVAFLATGEAFASGQCVQEVASGLREPIASIDPDPADGLLIEGDAVPISLVEGASAVAPRTIHAIGDAVIQADRACERPSAGAFGWVGPDDDREQRSTEIALDGCLTSVAVGLSRNDARTLAPLRRSAATARGVARTLERPPRA